jgi:uncharacterized protein YdcH (DUF465 family)
VESLFSRVDEIESRLSRLEDKADILEQSDEEKGKKYKWKMKNHLYTIKKPNL